MTERLKKEFTRHCAVGFMGFALVIAVFGSSSVRAQSEGSEIEPELAVVELNEEEVSLLTPSMDVSVVMMAEEDDDTMHFSYRETPVAMVKAVMMEPDTKEEKMLVMGVHAFRAPKEGESVIPDGLAEAFGDYAMMVHGEASGAHLGGMMGDVDVHVMAETLCEKNFIVDNICLDWINEHFGDTTCREAGIVSKHACEEYLLNIGSGKFPGCDGLSTHACNEHKALMTIGYVQDDALVKADALLEMAQEGGVIIEIPGITSVKPEMVGRTRWWGSPRAEGQQTSTGMIVIDADLDGLADDFEHSLGLSSAHVDSDGDGISDVDELRNGSNPLGSGMEKQDFTPTEKAIVFSAPLEQPTAVFDAEESFRIAISESGKDVLGEDVEENGDAHLSLRGKCDPDTTCILYMYSYIPMVLTTTTDSVGNWQYDLADSVVDGEHTVYVAVTDETGKITKRSNPLTFFVSAARAVTFDDFVAAGVQPIDSFGSGIPDSAAKKYLFFVLITLGIAGVFWRMILRTKRVKE